MARARLNIVEATKAWVLRECGWKVRDIGARFDVDPRRLYEVWQEVEHHGTRLRAMRLFGRMFPEQSLEGRFISHSQRFKRMPLSDDQPLLPGI